MKQNSDIIENHRAKKYSRQESLRRGLWVVGLQSFRLTPRPCFSIRRAILRQFGAKVGNQVRTYASSYVYFPWNLAIDEYSSIGEWVLIYSIGQITIGARTTISQRAHLCAGSHDYRQNSMPLLKLPITIGDDVWICADAYIGPRVVVGHNSIVAACSVVVKNVEANAIVGGNPARFIKPRSE